MQVGTRDAYLYILRSFGMTQKIKSGSILVVDDELGIRESLRMILKDKYNVSTSSSVDEAFKSLENTKADIVFLDVRMPKRNGIDFLQQIKSTNSTVPIIVITAFPSSQTAIMALRNGAFDYIIKPFEPSEILTVAERALSHRAKLSEKEKLVDSLRRAIRKNFFSTTEALLLAIDAKDSYTAGHAKRVSQLFAFVAKELGMQQSEVEVFRYGAFLHDIGKIGVSDYVLTKRGRLTEEEFILMKGHAEMGYKILEPINFLKKSLPAVRHHHERYNGEGYPDGLKGDEIPYEATVLSIVDAYDAINTDRPYHKSSSHQKTLETIRKEIGRQFAPTLTEKVIAAIDKYYKIGKEGKKTQNLQID